MRIIAGEARGRSLRAPKGTDTRPTLDRVRESLFSILMPRLAGARVLDLFAGSGALGLEALSRGAEAAVFADHARIAQVAVAENIEALRMRPRARLLRCDWRAALKRLAEDGEEFDIVFLDPPYQMPHADEMLAALRGSSLLTSGALVVYEHGRDNPPDLSGWKMRDRRTYRDTEISFLCLPGEGGSDADGAVSG